MKYVITDTCDWGGDGDISSERGAAIKHLRGYFSNIVKDVAYGGETFTNIKGTKSYFRDIPATADAFDSRIKNALLPIVVTR